MSFVVFLDVDGVLNTRTTCKRASSDVVIGIDESRVRLLARTMKKSGASGVVLTSTWKKLGNEHEDYLYLQEGLEKQGITILGSTNEERVSMRGEGILKYLEEHPDIDEFVILDDQHFDFDDDSKLWENFLCTDAKGIENAKAISRTPTVTAMVFQDMLNG